MPARRKIIHRNNREFLNFTNVNNRSSMYDAVTSAVHSFSYLPPKDRVHVLRICIHKVKENEL